MSNINNTSSKLSKTLASVAMASVTALCLLFFTKIGYNKIWFEKVKYYWDDFVAQRESDASLEQIKEERWGPAYKASKQIRDYFYEKGIKNPVILVEPNSYLQKTMGFQLPEPVIFYYYTGIKSVWMNNKSTAQAQATHFIYFRKNRMYIDTISSKEFLQKIISTYKAYP